jgi:hypothetical protein
MSRTRFALLGLPVLLAGALGAQTPAPQRALQVPSELAGFTLIDSTRFANPAAGIAYHYTDAGGLRATVYVYPISPAQRALASDSLRLADEAALFAAGLAIRQRQRRLDRFTIALNDPLPADSTIGAPAGRRTVAAIENRGATTYASQQVFLVTEGFLKIRLDTPVNLWDTSSAPGFGQRLAAHLVRDR